MLVARVLREVLAERGLEGFPKTSGSRGLHVIVPIEPRPWREVQALREAIGREVVARLPGLATMERLKRDRGARVYVDCGPQTVASAYSLRPGALVSAPVGVGRAGRGRARGLRRHDHAGALRARGGPDAVKPMLAKLVADIPPGLYYEPKWDGFRAIVVRDGDAVEIHSRNGKPMARYFPDLVAAFRAQLPARCTVDGEIVVISGRPARLLRRSSSACIPPPAASTGWRPRRPRASSRSTCSTRRSEPFRERAAPGSRRWAGRRRCTSRRSRATSTSRATGSSASRAPGSTA